MELSRRKADREEIMIVNIIKARKITLLLTLLTILISIPIIVPIMAQAIPIGTSHSVTLTWTAPIVTSGLSAISGYNIYRAPVVGAVNYVKLNTVINVPLTYTDTTVTSGSGYLYCVTTVDSMAAESACSGTVMANVPVNPNPPGNIIIVIISK